ncbi:MAG: hypothetical protein AB1941_05365 [Gemmatimonadota bacterium]
MVQIVENRTELEGVVEGPAGEDGRLRIRVLAAEPVEGFPNLLADDVGRVIELDGGAEPLPAGLGEGTRIHCRVRRAGLDRYFALPGSVELDGAG